MIANKLLKKCGFCAFCITFFISFFVSCEAEATLQAQKDGGVQITFSGSCGKYFENMIRSFVDDSNDTPLFDAVELRENFVANGFTNVAVRIPNNVSLETKMTDSGKSFLFTSGLLSCDKKNVSIMLSPEVLQKLYNAADEYTMTILDLFIAPVFNNEEMSEEEYLEIISSFYGSEAANEINNCDLKLSLISVDGQKIYFTIPLVKILTLNEKKRFPN